MSWGGAPGSMRPVRVTRVRQETARLFLLTSKISRSGDASVRAVLRVWISVKVGGAHLVEGLGVAEAAVKVGSDGVDRSAHLIGDSLVVSPHPEHLHSALFLQDLVHEPMLDVDASRVGAGEVTDQLFKRRQRLEGIFGEDVEQPLGFVAEP